MWIRAILTLCLAACLAVPASAGQRRDNDGNVWITDDITAGTPGAGSALGALVMAASDTMAAFETHRFDLQLALVPTGAAGDDNAQTERALAGITLYYRPSAWLRVGPSLQWDPHDSGKLAVSVVGGAKLFPDPWSAVSWWLSLDLLPHLSVLTADSEDGPSRISALTWAPGTEFTLEVPMGLWSVEGGLGAVYPFSIEGVTEQDENAAVEQLALTGRLAINLRLGR